jgi:probable addiction module antidote protein
MMETKTAPYDVAEFLETPEEMAAYLEACIQESDGDAAFIAKALGDIARAKGMTQIAREAGLSRESLYKALSGDRSPSFDTILKVISALGLQLSASVREDVTVEDVAEVAWLLLVQLKYAGVACGNATLRTSPSSGQATITSQLRHPTFLACHSRAAFEGSQNIGWPAFQKD